MRLAAPAIIRPDKRLIVPNDRRIVRPRSGLHPIREGMGARGLHRIQTGKVSATPDSANPYAAFEVFRAHFTGTNGQTSATDIATGKAITFSGTAQIQSNALLLDGNSDFIDTPDHADFWFDAGPYCVEALGVTPAALQSSIIVNQHDTASNRGWAMEIQGGATFAGTYSLIPTVPNVNGFGSYSAGVKYNVAITRDASGVLRYFVDNVMGFTTTMGSSLNNSTAVMRIGARSNASPSAYFNGSIEKVVITKGSARGATDSGYSSYP